MLSGRGLMLSGRGLMLSGRGLMLSGRGLMLSGRGLMLSGRALSAHVITRPRRISRGARLRILSQRARVVTTIPPFKGSRPREPNFL
jgi:hypothetical protein